MTRGKSSRKSDQKGVEAIFSSSREPRRARVILGGLVLFVGIFSIVVTVVMVQFPHLWDRSAAAFYGSLGFASIGVYLLTCGGGIIVSGLQLFHSLRPSAAISGGSDDSLQPTDVVRDTSALSSSRASKNPSIRLPVTVFLQGCILLSLYAGLVEEYQSNATMQAWVRSSLDSAQYLLNWGALLVSSFLIGVLVVYSLVTKDLVE